MRVTVHRSATLESRALAEIREGGLAPLLRRSGDVLGVPARAGLAVRLTDDEELRRLNRLHAGVDAATDVLAFPGDGRAWVGDIAISVERARAQLPRTPPASSGCSPSTGCSTAWATTMTSRGGPR